MVEEITDLEDDANWIKYFSFLPLLIGFPEEMMMNTKTFVVDYKGRLAFSSSWPSEIASIIFLEHFLLEDVV